MSGARRRANHLVEAGALALLGAVVLFDARGYPPPLTAGAPGPAFFPRLAAVMLIACALWLAARSIRGGARPPASAGPAVPANDGIRPAAAGGLRDRLRVWAAAGAIAAFLLALPHLGTLAALPLLLFGLMRLAGERARAVLIAAPLVFAGFVVLLFEAVLGVPLP